MVCTHAAVAYTTKWKLWHCYLHDHIIHTSLSRRRKLQHFLTEGLKQDVELIPRRSIFNTNQADLCFGEHIQRQWFLPSIDEFDGLIYIVYLHDGQHRAKYFILHYLSILRYVCDNCWSNVLVLRKNAS